MVLGRPSGHGLGVHRTEPVGRDPFSTTGNGVQSLTQPARKQVHGPQGGREQPSTTDPVEQS
jgi:hypothetical protein